MQAAAVAACQRQWRDVKVLQTARPLEAVDLVRGAVEEGVERVLVLGGDGTVHEAANGLLTAGRSPLPALGVLPVGTGNDFAKLLGVHRLSASVVVERLASARVVPFDVGRAWGEFFINAVGIGFDAEVARRVSGLTRLRGILAYLVAVGQAYGGFRPFRVSVECGTERFEDEFLLIEVAIGATVGGGFRLTPAARPDDGLFDVCAISRLSLPGFLTKLPLAMLGWHTRRSGVRMLRTTHLTITGRDGPLLAHLDGEVRSQGAQMEITLEAARLPVLVV
jgi:YegS/Rv2252/BmrU family lipid kinase